MVGVLRGMRLGYAGPVLLAATLGTPLFYYATFVPGRDHALDALLFSAVVYLTYRYFRSAEPERWLPFALGVVLGFSYTVRYFSGAEAVVLVSRSHGSGACATPPRSRSRRRSSAVC